MIPLIFPKVPQSCLGILRVPQLHPPLEHPPPSESYNLEAVAPFTRPMSPSRPAGPGNRAPVSRPPRLPRMSATVPGGVGTAGYPQVDWGEEMVESWFFIFTIKSLSDSYYTIWYLGVAGPQNYYTNSRGATSKPLELFSSLWCLDTARGLLSSPM